MKTFLSTIPQGALNSFRCFALSNKRPAVSHRYSNTSHRWSLGSQHEQHSSYNRGIPIKGVHRPRATDNESEGEVEKASESPEEQEQTTGRNLQLPTEVIQRLRNIIFGFDFFVTSVENYQANGVIFKGNLRGDPSVAYDRIAARLKGELGEDYVLYLLEDQEEKPVAVVLPKDAAEQPLPPTQEALLSVAFGLATLVTLLNANGLLLLQPEQLDLSASSILSALPGTLLFFLLLGAHELGHRVAAAEKQVELGTPLFVPAGLGFLGSFGAITSFRSTLPDRASLLHVAAYGPAFGAAAALAMLLVGLGLSAAGIGDGEMQPVAFQDSLFVGILGQLFVGSKLAQGAAVSLNPLLAAGWAGLLANALNCIPVGVLDGGRIAHGLWGRRNASRLNIISLFLLGVTGIFDTLSLFWVLFVIFLQRGPISPQKEELSQPESQSDRVLGLCLLGLSLLVLLPYPGTLVPDTGF
ncbi:probable zinc metalloprotease EGY2, chloroplastic [Coccomyxa sp. Obi]|nr:probable zinc metalloprotease EGY2, chloroplastic [Coccomyxa sp. Obi]